MMLRIVECLWGTICDWFTREKGKIITIMRVFAASTLLSLGPGLF